MPRLTPAEVSEHDSLVLMMAQYFKQSGYSDVRADIPGWVRPDGISWSGRPDAVFFPDVTCKDSHGTIIILEAETRSTLEDQHTREQFEIFRAHASSHNGRFEVVVPRICEGAESRQRILDIAKGWNIMLDNVYTPNP